MAAVRVRGIDLVFIGTRGNTIERTSRHRRHSSLLVQSEKQNIMIDCGADWLRSVARLSPTAVVLTHGHPDHAQGLARGAPCPVFATEETWQLLRTYPISHRRILIANVPFKLGDVTLTAFPVAHSVRAPAVGYRIARGKTAFFYAPDLVSIQDRRRALTGIDLYIGDGACIVHPIVRHRQGIAIGHSPIRTQLDWCQEQGVRDAIFTHCGSQIVTGNQEQLNALVGSLGQERDVTARIAFDGMRVTVPLGQK